MEDHRKTEGMRSPLHVYIVEMEILGPALCSLRQKIVVLS
jgi:hypothetical protein